MRFKSKQFGDTFWCVVDTLDNDEPIFGDKCPKTEEECNQQARAANIAASIIFEDLKRKVFNFYESIKY